MDAAYGYGMVVSRDSRAAAYVETVPSDELEICNNVVAGDGEYFASAREPGKQLAVSDRGRCDLTNY